MSYNISQGVLDLLNSKINTLTNKVQAQNYLKNNRKLSIPFIYPPLLTTDLSKFVQLNNNIFKQDWLSDSIYFPIHDINNTLVGYDVRYVGKNKDRTRFYKIKVDTSNLFNYNSKDILSTSDVLFICEGVIDLETLRSLLNIHFKHSYAIISPLTCLTNPKYFEMLLLAFKHIVICYDNDNAGTNAKIKIKTWAETNNVKNIKFLNFLGKDINDSYKQLGSYSLIQGIYQISAYLKYYTTIK